MDKGYTTERHRREVGQTTSPSRLQFAQQYLEEIRTDKEEEKKNDPLRTGSSSAG